MKRFNLARNLALPVMFTLFSVVAYSQNAWINEMHYDNIGTDAGEFIEVVIQDAGDYNMGDFNITLYNGNGGLSYGTYPLSGFSVGATINSFTFLYKIFPVNGLQNGAPDGLALVYQSTVQQFLSYEGTFVATNGPAAGMLSVDIGVKDDLPIPASGTSLQLQGEGSSYADFFWAGPLPDDTPGELNFGQTLVSPITTPLSDWAIVLGVLLIGIFAFLRIRRNS